MLLFDGLTDPPIGGGRDVPELRLTLLQRWRPGAPYWQAARMMLPRDEDDLPSGVVPFSPGFDGTALANATLWYVTEDMATLVEHAAQTLPPTTLCDALVPDDWGFAVFAKPMTGTDTHGGFGMYVWALLWGVTTINQLETGDGFAIRSMADGTRPDDGSPLALTISCYGRMGADRAPGSLAPDGPWYPQGRSDWRWDTETAEAALPEFAATKYASMQEERRWLAALWLLAAQPISDTDGRAHAPRPARRRANRLAPGAGRLMDSEVRLIDVRRRAVPREPGDTTGGTRKWGHRTVVTGHWRQQAYGPGWSQRRPVFIAEHIAGPEGAPLVVRESVKVVRSSPAETPPDI